ncbi:hypothetical protein CC80DRAFT_550534 [Byssothecium circinans]|uniref:Ricin B lectin domain-containing protein n=1 Tax=Byssothecium circinans TaxID=147558 RepID=A0A6A5TQ25_9PLEO|nr:hypothetical protein CC80DRAFT_550534 [Byssothecium circinans]
MKSFTLIAPFLTALLSTGATAAPTTTPSTLTTSALDARGDNNWVFIGRTTGAKITWHAGQDVCYGKYLTLAQGTKTNPCGIPFDQGSDKLMYQGCGERTPELWRLGADGKPAQMLSTCNEGYGGKKQSTHSCGLWQAGVVIEWSCPYSG